MWGIDTEIIHTKKEDIIEGRMRRKWFEVLCLQQSLGIKHWVIA